MSKYKTDATMIWSYLSSFSKEISRIAVHGTPEQQNKKQQLKQIKKKERKRNKKK